MDVKRFVLSYYTEAAKNFHIARVTHPTEALNLHSHNYFQIYYVNGGKLIHHLGEHSATLSRGDVFILPPDQPHYIEAEEKVDFYSLSFLPDFVASGGEKTPLVRDFLSYLTSAAEERILPKITLSYDDMIFAEPIFHRTLSEHQGDRAGKSERIRSCVQLLLSLVASIYFEEKEGDLQPQENETYVRYCIEYMEHHFDEDITLSRMVPLSAMSKSSFCSIFHAVTGTTFKAYLNRYRIRKAEEMLSAGEKTGEVARLCGYRDPSTFYRNFQKIVGISPTEYRQRKEKQAE